MRRHPDVAEAERESEKLFKLIRPKLAGYEPEIQGLVLAKLTALWLAGHKLRGAGRTDELTLRADLLDHFTQLVFDLEPHMTAFIEARLQ